ncbi:hypothetical protein MMMDOFMJ_2901 [Methylobacterium gnaphalii]|uniref:Uncharacterized protein n=2 Tax=Methylobacterium gnaphalii TaxID=1010610 RepID=A0A512JRZ3_9HYPH|nr:hypothetical protein MGN01_45600 [Methylobacterium gnaphalii]GJD69962.1 hypothetical protein MMMDOFMJ_2901 [Methylobacterium gnaphalii]GLS50463.1 hypothetical protein GCM10007885_33150 [Methylobacterium gnaphalii]
MHSNDKTIYSGAFVLAALSLVTLLWLFSQNELARQPHLISVSSTDFLETKISGNNVVYSLLHAQVEAPARAEIRDLIKYAENIFAAKLRSDAEAQSKTMIWITFHYAGTGRHPGKSTKTYREIYVFEGTNWRRVTNKNETFV